MPVRDEAVQPQELFAVAVESEGRGKLVPSFTRVAAAYESSFVLKFQLPSTPISISNPFQIRSPSTQPGSPSNSVQISPFPDIQFAKQDYKLLARMPLESKTRSDPSQ